MMIDFETAKQLLSYNKVTGEIFWTLAAYKTVKGKKAGTLRPNGYKQIRVFGKIYKEHRLVWLLVHGVFPNGQIDHINGNPFDELNTGYLKSGKRYCKECQKIHTAAWRAK